MSWMAFTGALFLWTALHWAAYSRAEDALGQLGRLAPSREFPRVPAIGPARPVLLPELDAPLPLPPGTLAAPLPLCRWLDPEASGIGMTAGWSDEQRRIFGAYAAQRGSPGGAGTSPERVLRGLRRSEIFTIDSVTHALEAIRLEADGGADLGPAGALVSGLLEVHGSDGTGQGRSQFRLIVSLRPGAVDRLERARNFSKGRTGHLFRGGRLVKGLRDFRLKDGPPSLQISVSEDGGVADVDVDYRGLFEGHFKPYNSDAMARGPQKDSSGRPIDNLRRHSERWGPFLSPARLLALDCLDP